MKSIEISHVSGASILKAPEIGEIIQLMYSPDIHGVVTREASRLMRPENFADYDLLQAFVDSKRFFIFLTVPSTSQAKQVAFSGRYEPRWRG